MPTAILTMRKLKEILRLKYGCALWHRQIARSLSISPGTVSDLGEHVLVKVVFGVSIFHGNGVDHVDYFIQQGRIWDDEHRVLHEFCVRTTRPTVERFDKSEDFILENIKLSFRFVVFETRPAKMFLIFFEDGIDYFLTQ